MAKTGIADIIIPTVFEQYAMERTAELSRFGQCGIIESSPVFDELARGGGRTVEMPFWKDLTATRQLLSDSASLTVNKITADKDIARAPAVGLGERHHPRPLRRDHGDRPEQHGQLHGSAGPVLHLHALADQRLRDDQRAHHRHA